MKIEIHSTTNYKVFAQFQENREIDEKHVEYLMASIQRKNLLSICPVIVGDNFEVIDGQHRIEAAKNLGVEIFYIKADNLDVEDIISLNNVRKPWKIHDYFNFWYIKKRFGFTQVNTLMRKLGWPLNLVGVMVTENGAVPLKNIKAGHMDISNMAFVKNILEIVFYFYDSSIRPPVSFVKAVRHLVSGDYGGKKHKITNEYNHQAFTKFLTSHTGAFDLECFWYELDADEYIDPRNCMYGTVHAYYYALKYLHDAVLSELKVLPLSRQR